MDDTGEVHISHLLSASSVYADAQTTERNKAAIDTLVGLLQIIVADHLRFNRKTAIASNT